MLWLSVISFYVLTGIFTSGIPVSTVAEAMLQDALSHHAQPSASSNVVTYYNADIRRLVQVCLCARGLYSGISDKMILRERDDLSVKTLKVSN